MKELVDMIGSLHDCISSIDDAEEGSAQYYEAIRATREELQSFLPQSNEVPPEYLSLKIDWINATIKGMEPPLKCSKFLIGLSLGEFIQSLINQCDISDFPDELQKKLFGK